ncbi:MAG: phytoene/squalene synthase family protein, partial [Planctomycetota bacterium]
MTVAALAPPTRSGTFLGDGFDAVPADGGAVIRVHSRSFSLACRTLPRRFRADVERLYAWCRWCDDAVDGAPDSTVATARLSTLQEDVARLTRGESPVHPASAWLEEVMMHRPIDPADAVGLLNGMATDLEPVVIPDVPALLAYCDGAAGTVGRLMCGVFGVSGEEARRRATALGIAMQLTNIARDVREDWLRGRRYLPANLFDDAAPVPGSSDDLGAIPGDDQFGPVVRSVLELAEEYYGEGLAGVRLLPAGVRPAVRAGAGVYRAIGLRIMRSGGRVADGRTRLPTWARLGAAACSVVGLGLPPAPAA